MKRPIPAGDAGRSSESEEEMLLPTKSSVGKTTDPKKMKLASIFQPRSAPMPLTDTSNGAASSSASTSSASLKWLLPIGEKKSCLHGIYGDPQPATKIAFFDLDGTIVKPKGTRAFPSATDEYDYTFNLPGISNIVAKIQEQHFKHGYSIVIITNQKQSPDGRNAEKPKTKLVTWKKKLAHIAKAIDVPLHVFAALGDDIYRKPMLGSWYEFCQHWNDGLAVDLTKSFYVGDAAGRTGPKDHNDTDLKWALNAGLPFFTPEEYFLEKRKCAYKTPSKPWEQVEDTTQATLSALISDPRDDMVRVTRDNLDTTIRKDATGPEIVLFVGPPASGKTTFYERVFGNGKDAHVHINQDTLRTRQRCLQLAEAALTGADSGEPRSCVIDNTNRDKATRKLYIDLASKLGVSIRCVYFSASWAHCIHNNYYRSLVGTAKPQGQPVRELLPYTAMQSFFRDVQLPTRDEGFAKNTIYLVDWEFDGDEEERKRYEMYHF